MSVSIAVLDDYQHVALEFADWRRLDGRATVQVFSDHLADEHQLYDRLAPFDIVVSMRERTPFPRSLLEQLTNLKLLVTTGMMNAAIDVAAATALGVTVSGTGGLGYPTAELTWGLIFSLARNIPGEDASIRRGGWQTGIGPELGGKTLGVIGLGHLGRRVAAVGRAFEMEVIAWSQNLTAADAERVGASCVPKDELLARADVVTIHLKLSERTHGLIGRRELALMRPSAYLVNTSRGPIVDEEALVEALRGRRIAGAGLDVFDVEPLPPDHPLRALPNTVVTPHIGYVTSGTYEIFYGQVLEDIESYLAGEPIRVMKE